MRPWDLVVVVYIKILMYGVNNYPWFSCVAISQAILNDFSLWSLSDPTFVFFRDFLNWQLQPFKRKLFTSHNFAARPSCGLLASLSTVLVGLMIRETRNDIYFDFQNSTEHSQGYHNVTSLRKSCIFLFFVLVIGYQETLERNFVFTWVYVVYDNLLNSSVTYLDSFNYPEALSGSQIIVIIH